MHFCLPIPQRQRVCRCAENRTSECVPTIVAGPHAMTVFHSQTVSLFCEVDSKGFDTDVEIVKDGSAIYFEHATSAHTVRRTVAIAFTIDPISYNDTGEYSCRAANEHGSDTSRGGILTVIQSDCVSFPCQHGGTCDIVSYGYRCDCRRGFSGKHCETDMDECLSFPCLNGGNCTDGVNGYICGCKAGYTGIHCEISKADVCISTPCRNGGTCTEGSNVYTCSCHHGFTGANCETAIGACESNPCQNGGTRMCYVNKHICNCRLGFSGDDCETNVDDCESNPCQNGASCLDLINEYVCNCSDLFSGKTCAECRCQNGGVCINADGVYSCSCLPRYIGTLCEEIVPDAGTTAPATGSGSGNTTAISAAVAAVVVVLIVAVAVVVILRRRRRASFQPSRENDASQVTHPNAFHNPSSSFQPAVRNDGYETPRRAAFSQMTAVNDGYETPKRDAFNFLNETGVKNDQQYTAIQPIQREDGSLPGIAKPEYLELSHDGVKPQSEYIDLN